MKLTPSFAALLLFISGLVASGSDFMWRPTTISLSVEFRDSSQRKGQYILLKNSLQEGETGWTMFKIAIPDSWVISDLGFQEDMMRFKIQSGESFSIAPPQLNELDFILLSRGEKSQEEIESLWRKYAKK